MRTADITSPTTSMAYSWTWTNQEKTGLHRVDSEGNVRFVPSDPANTDFIEFCNSGAIAAPFVEAIAVEGDDSPNFTEGVTGHG